MSGVVSVALDHLAHGLPRHLGLTVVLLGKVTWLQEPAWALSLQ